MTDSPRPAVARTHDEPMAGSKPRSTRPHVWHNAVTLTNILIIGIAVFVVVTGWDGLTQPQAVLLAGLSALTAAGIAFYGTHRTRISNEKTAAAALAQTQEEARHRRYTDASAQLGHKAAAIRLAGVYAMAALADDWYRAGDISQRQVVIDVLTAYYRSPPRPDANDEEVRRSIRRLILDRTATANRDLETSWISCYFDLSGANLSGTDFSRAELRGANFCGASFTDAGFSDEALGREIGAIFVGSDFSNVDFRAGSLSWVDFSNATFGVANLEGVRLRRANLTGAQLHFANMTNSDLTDANLTRATLVHTQHRGSRFVRANLTGAVLTGVDMSGVDFTGANLTGADLHLVAFGDNLGGMSTPAILADIKYDMTTKWPANFVPPPSRSTD